MKSPSANTEAGICLPGEQTWELWKHGSGGWQPAQAENSPADFKTAAVFGYPVSAAFAVPIRAATGDEELMPDIVDFQLEKQNMKPETPVGRLLDWRMVDRGENNTLLLATVLSYVQARVLVPGIRVPIDRHDVSADGLIADETTVRAITDAIAAVLAAIDTTDAPPR